MNEFPNLFKVFKYKLMGRKSNKALTTLEFAHKYHNVVRKDGETPELEHEIEISMYLMTL